MLEFALIAKLLYLAAGGILLTAGIDYINKGRHKLATGKIGKSLDVLEGKDGLLLSENHQLTEKKSYENVMVIAPPGEGKTTSVTIPNLLSNHLPISSLIIGDPKGELWDLTHEYQQSIGRKPILFDPLGKKAKYNLLKNCRDNSEVDELAQSILANGELAMMLENNKSGGNAEWVNMAVSLLSASLMHERECGNGFIPNAINTLVKYDIECITNIYLHSQSEDAVNKFRIFERSLTSQATYSGIFTTLLSNVRLFTDRNLSETLSGNDFTPEQLRQEPVALYIKYQKPNYLAPFLAVFYSQLINHIADTTGIPVFFLLDEFQNLGRINGIEHALALYRDKKLSFLCCLQNISRLYQIYGEHTAQTIFNCLKTKLVLPSISDKEALSYLSTLCDFTQVNIVDDKGHAHPHRKDLFTPGEIRRIPDNKILIVAHNKQPILDSQNLWYTQEKYKKNATK